MERDVIQIVVIAPTVSLDFFKPTERDKSSSVFKKPINSELRTLFRVRIKIFKKHWALIVTS